MCVNRSHARILYLLLIVRLALTLCYSFWACPIFVTGLSTICHGPIIIVTSAGLIRVRSKRLVSVLSGVGPAKSGAVASSYRPLFTLTEIHRRFSESQLDYMLFRGLTERVWHAGSNGRSEIRRSGDDDRHFEALANRGLLIDICCLRYDGDVSAAFSL
jgi:hypothetical protein